MDKLKKYIGIPFEDHGRTLQGADCLGLVMMVYKDILGVDLPDVAKGYDEAIAKAQVQGCILDYASFDKIEDVTHDPRQYLDVLVYRIGGFECHVGLWLDDERMLHLIEGQHAVIVRHTAMQWKKRLAKVYRHVSNN